MTDGTSLRGRVTEETADSVSIRTYRGMSMTIPLSRVHKITTKKGTREVNPIEGIEPAPPVPAGRRGRPEGETAPGEKSASAKRLESKKGAFPPNAVAGRELPPPGPAEAAYMKETWPEARLLVWAHPGEGGQRGFDALDPKNWLEGGRPASSPPDKDTDIVLPDADAYYSTARAVITCRHVTIGRNARLLTKGRTVYGNTWIRSGGESRNGGNLSFKGGRHTFIRNDNPDKAMVSQYVVHDKPGASCEFIGRITTMDEFKIFNGTLVVAPDSRVEPGRNAMPVIGPSGTLALMDGAHFGKWINQFNPDMKLRGTIQGGLPRRPLTRDCLFGLSFHNHEKTDFPGEGEKFRKMLLGHKVSMIVGSGAALRVFSRDLERATMVVGWHGIDKTYKPPGLTEVEKKHGKQIQRKVTLWFDADTTVEGVRFDHIHKGGLILRDPSTRGRWKNVTFGEGCDGKPDELFAQGTVGRNGEY
jgi:hypothetical protein